MLRVFVMEVIRHVGIFKNAVPKDLCDKFIQMFELAHENNAVYTRHQAENVPSVIKDDTSRTVDLTLPLGDIGDNQTPYEFMKLFWPLLDQYAEKYGALRDGPEMWIPSFKIQKTNPTQGYHVWHFENAGLEALEARVLTFMVYLNDVEEGGETEFLYESVRVKPETGKLLIWPVSYTHTHRGNPPLSGTKYIITASLKWK